MGFITSNEYLSDFIIEFLLKKSKHLSLLMLLAVRQTKRHQTFLDQQDLHPHEQKSNNKASTSDVLAKVAKPGSHQIALVSHPHCFYYLSLGQTLLICFLPIVYLFTSFTYKSKISLFFSLTMSYAYRLHLLLHT